MVFATSISVKLIFLETKELMMAIVMTTNRKLISFIGMGAVLYLRMEKIAKDDANKENSDIYQK